MTIRSEIECFPSVTIAAQSEQSAVAFLEGELAYVDSAVSRLHDGCTYICLQYNVTYTPEHPIKGFPNGQYSVGGFFTQDNEIDLLNISFDVGNV